MITEDKVPAKLLEKPNPTRIVPKMKHAELPEEQIPAKTLDESALSEMSETEKVVARALAETTEFTA
ncbi:MAG: hypothetical protein ACI4JZ_06310 [Oscillospiraceae bacterium]